MEIKTEIMRWLVYIVMVVAVTACGYESAQPRVLEEARAEMKNDPAAALSKLNSVDVSEFDDSATMAEWALLYAEALAANRLTAPTDTIVNIAIDYYGSHNLTDEFQKASRLKTLIQNSDTTDALATALYLQKEKEFFLYKERAKRQQLTLAGCIVLLIVAGIIVWMRQRMKLQSADNERLMAEASSLKCSVVESRGDVSRLEGKLKGLLENRFALIDSLCQTYYESQGTKNERKAIVEKVKSEIESVQTDYLPEMEQAVNDCRNDILAKVKELYPDIKMQDYQLLVYIASGLSTRTICLLLDESADVVYKRKSRLKSRLKEASGTQNQEIMALF